MLQTYYVFKKELRQFLFSPIAYIVAGVFHSILGYFFYNSLISYSRKVVEMSGTGAELEVPSLVQHRTSHVHSVMQEQRTTTVRIAQHTVWLVQLLEGK